MDMRFINVRVLMSEYKKGDSMKSYGAKKPSGHGSVIVGSSWASSSSIEVGIATPERSKAVEWAACEATSSSTRGSGWAPSGSIPPARALSQSQLPGAP
eukprot:scaffold74345_cov48-Phaeocystis_antarctica.AAC.1